MTGAAQPEHSIFVTVVAWVVIGLSAMATPIGSVQDLMIHVMFPLEKMRAQVSAQSDSEHLPRFAGLMFERVPWFFGAVLGVAVFTLAASIELL